MNATEKRALIPLLKRVLNDTINHGTKSTARYWLHRLQKPRSKPGAQRKEAKAAQHREGLQTKPEGLPAVAFPKPDGDADRDKKRTGHAVSTAEIRAAVLARCGGFCEVCDLMVEGEDLDHWLGGWGRRRQRQSVANTWFLCRPHHRARTEYRPSVTEWNYLFKRHCERFGYPFEPHIEHADLPRKAAP